MKKSELKEIINESVAEVFVEQTLQESFNYDAAQLHERMLSEGFADSTKSVMQDVPAKTKQQLTEPLIYAILQKLKQSDPKGFAQLQQYAKDPKKLNQLLNHPTIQKQSAKAGKELANGQLNEGDSEFEESFYNHLEEALQRGKVPAKYQAAAKAYSDKNPSQKYDWNKSVDDNTPKKPDAGGAFGKTKWKLKPRDPVKPQKYEDPESFPSKRDTPPETKKPEPSADPKNKKNSLIGMIDKTGIAALKGLGKAGDIIGDKLKKIGQTKSGQMVAKATGGIVSRASSFIKNHPKLSAGVALGLIAAIGTAAAVGSGGVIPLIASTLTAGVGGAVKGGAIGSVVGAGKEMVKQARGDNVKSFKDINYKQVGKSALKAGGKGAAIGAAVGAGANVLGKAAAGAGKMFGGNAATGQSAVPNAAQAKAQVAGIVNRANQDADKIVKMLMDPSANNQNLGFDYQITKDLNLGDVLRSSDPSGTGMDTADILGFAKTYAENGQPEQARILLSQMISKGLNVLQKTGELDLSSL